MYSERGILELIQADAWMMSKIQLVADQEWPDWVIGAGFVRNKIWDHLHGRSTRAGSHVAGSDIDVVYYDPAHFDRTQDDEFTRRLQSQSGDAWEVRNQARMHIDYGKEPYTSSLDGLAHWTETATAVGVTLRGGALRLVAPYGIDDLVNLRVRVCPKCVSGPHVVRQRVAAKGWLQRWPRLQICV